MHNGVHIEIFMTLNIQANLWYKSHLSRQYNWWSLSCSWSIACRRCSNYIFTLGLTHGFIGFGKDNLKTRQETFKYWGLVQVILQVWRYVKKGLKTGVVMVATVPPPVAPLITTYCVLPATTNLRQGNSRYSVIMEKDSESLKRHAPSLYSDVNTYVKR